MNQPAMGAPAVAGQNAGEVKSNRTRSCSVLGMRVDEHDYLSAVEQLRLWSNGESRYVCCSTVHMAIEAYEKPDFRNFVNSADMVVSDGVPIVWVTRRLGLDRQVRVDAPTLTMKLCAMATEQKIPVGFYGSTPEILRDLIIQILKVFPGLNISYSYSPPFRPLSSTEDQQVVDDICKSGTRLLFVGLGCPKQERWMFEHRGKVPALMLGVGWTFDVLSGHEHMAPRYVQRAGLEWVYRIIQNPKKVGRRHLRTDPKFVVLSLGQVLGLLHYPLGSGHGLAVR